MIKQVVNEDIIGRAHACEGSTLLFHGCNAQGVMGAGLAKAVRAQWPWVYSSYREFCQRNSDLVGRVHFAEADERVWVANGITQEYYGRPQPNSPFASPEAIESCLEIIAKEALQFDHYLAPKVGCGLGGLSWETVAGLFDASPLEWVICYI